jgi:hypothetical protein
MIAAIAVAIVLSGPMVSGYAVLDEFAFYVMLGLFLLQTGILFWKRPQSSQEPRLQKLHRLVFLLFAAYLIVESLRGIWVLHDIRAIRFTALFGALGIFAWTVHPKPFAIERTEIARIILKAGIIYLLAYVLAGAIVEIFFHGWRLDLQGHLWSGTTAALYPVCIIVPALFALDEKSDRVLFWVGFLTILTAGFYYQSRLVWLTIIVLIVIGLPTWGIRRTSIAAAIFAAFITIFPWAQAGPLPPEIFKTVAARNLDGFFRGQALANADRFRVAIFGGATAVPEPLDEADIKLLHDSAQIVQQKVLLEKRKATLEAAAVTGDANARQELDEIRGKLNAMAETLEKAKAVRARLSETLMDKDVGDVDRKLALLAAIHYVSHNGPVEFLFGSGYYTHRYKLLKSIHAVADRYGYTFPETYNEIVRTAIFNGMMVDTGIIGMLLLFSLFALTAITVLASVGFKNLLKPGPHLASLAGLGLVALSMNVGATYDSVLLYLALMPSGAFLILYPQS